MPLFLRALALTLCQKWSLIAAHHRREGRISFIRDYRYVRYIAADAELVLAVAAQPAGNGAVV